MLGRLDLALFTLALGAALAYVLRRRDLARSYLLVTLALATLTWTLFAAHAMTALAGVALAVDLIAGAGFVLRGASSALALRIVVASGFVLSALAKGFDMDEMVGFFAQSGYSPGFLRFIVVAEVVGGLALLLPWRITTLAAAAGLAVDMFGAIFTHLDRGAPMDDYAGAVVMLVKLGLVVAHTGRLAPGGFVAAATAACGLAVAGQRLVRQPGRLPAPAPAPAPAPDRSARLIGAWRCAGHFVTSGKAIEADLVVARELPGWLTVRHDDRPPNPYHARGEWRDDLAVVVDSSGGARVFYTAGWRGDTLIWEGGDLGGPAHQRFVYELRDEAHFDLHYDRLRPEGWATIDTERCTRSR